MIDEKDRLPAPRTNSLHGLGPRRMRHVAWSAAVLFALAHPVAVMAQNAPAQPGGDPRPAARSEPATDAEPAQSVAPAAEATDNANAGDDIFLQLNNLQPLQPTGCRLSFVATNEKAEAIDQLGVEVVVFDASNRIDQFLMLEFTRLPSGKTKAAQFDLAERSCDEISQLLVNDILNCGNESESEPTCTEAVRLDNLTDIELAF